MKTPTIAEDVAALKEAVGRYPLHTRDRWKRILTHIANLEARDTHTCHDDCKRAGCVNGRLGERVKDYKAALEALTTKTERITKSPEFTSVFTISQIHGCPYKGETFQHELRDARAILAKHSGERGEGK